MACAVCWECGGLACRREEKSQWNGEMLLEHELSILRCGYPSSSGGRSSLFAQDSLPGRSPACEMLPLLPLPDVLASPGVLESPEEPEAATSGESPWRWHGRHAARWRELQQSCSCLFSLRWFLTSFYPNPGCLVPIQVPAGEEQWEGGSGAGCGHASEAFSVAVPAWSLVGSACAAGLLVLGTAVPVSGLACPAQPGVHLSCSPGCFFSPGGTSAMQVPQCWFCTD